MTILRRMLLGYAGLLFLLVVVAGLGMSGLSWLEGSFNEYNETTRQQTDGAAAICEAALPMSYLAQSAVLAPTQTLRDRYSTEMSAAHRETKDAIDSVFGLEGAEGNSDDAATLAALAAQLATYHDAVLDLIDTAASDQQQAFADLDSDIIPMGEEFDAAVHAYEDDQANEEAAVLSSISRNGTILIIITSVVVALAIGAAVLLQRSASGDITRRLRGAVSSLSSSSAEILAIASQVAAGAAQTAASTNETTVTVEEVKQTAMLAHEKAASAAKGAQGAVGVIGSARKLAEETVVGIEHMQGEMDVLFETINRLSERTQAAGEIIASVNDLAEQSNLLSVNASIEAAKAGEYGKGFTVVAQEVKSLAEQSKQAVSQVRAMLGEIQKASDTAVQAAASGREAVEAGRRRSMEAVEVMERVAEGAGDDAQASLQVVASSQQQLAGMEQIGQAIAAINSATAQAVAGTRQVEKEVEQLQELAVSLRSLVQTQETASRRLPPAGER